MQDLNHLAKIIAERKGMTLEEATQKVNEITHGKTLFGAKLAINHYLEIGIKVGETTLKGYHETESHERIKE